MRITKCFILFAGLLAALSGAVFAQESIIDAKDEVYEFQAGAYITDAEGNQDWAREFDGRRFASPNIELFDIYGYDRNMQYNLSARDLPTGDESVDFSISHQNIVTFSGGVNTLTHRLFRTPADNPWVADQLTAMGGVPAPNIGLTWDTFKDLDPDGDFAMKRRVTNADLYINADRKQRVGINAGLWQENEYGNRQLLFRARQAQPGVMNNSQRGAVDWPIDRDTTLSFLGADVAIGDKSVANYKLESTQFKDHTNRPITGSALDFLPLNSFTKYGSKTHSSTVKARTDISDKLQFTGVYTNKRRSNNSNDVPPNYIDEGNALRKTTAINSTNLAMVYRPIDSLSFTGRYRNLRYGDRVPAIFATGGTTPANPTQSQNTRTVELEGVFTGISKTYLRFGFESRDIDRRAGELSPVPLDLIPPATSAETNWNIWRAALRYRPISRLSVSANYEDWDAGNSGYNGAPNNRKKTNANATYMVRDDMALYADYNRWKENNDEIRVAGAIPDQALTDGDILLREEAAGQGFNTRFTSSDIGTWFMVSDKLTLDANFSSIKMDSAATWVLGIDPAWLPHLPAQFTPFSSDNDQWSLGANYRASNRLKLNGRLFRSTADGVTSISPANMLGLGPDYTPFRIRQNRWMIGFDYGLTSKDKLGVNFSTSRWTDRVDAGQTGRFNLWQMSWRRQF